MEEVVHFLWDNEVLLRIHAEGSLDAGDVLGTKSRSMSLCLTCNCASDADDSPDVDESRQVTHAGFDECLRAALDVDAVLVWCTAGVQVRGCLGPGESAVV